MPVIVRRPLCLLLLLLATQAFAQSATPTFPNPGKTAMSRENQQALGMQAAAQVYEKMPVLPDSSPESVYVRELGRKLVATIPAEYSWPFEFHVIPQKEINAFALPGGQMFINVGTITAAKNEAELAGVMAHEMSHVYMQHSAKQASKAQTTSMIAGLAAAVLGSTIGSKGGGLVGQLGQLGIQLGAEGVMMKYSRSDEAQADSVGAVVLYKAGYNPQGMADFFRTMGAQGGSAPPVFFSSHPAASNRQQAIEKLTAKWPPTDYAVASAAFDRVHAHASQLQVYTAAEIDKGSKTGQWASLNRSNGASLGASGESSFPTRPPAETAAAALQKILPSSRMVSANLGPLKIDHPENWPVTLPEKQGKFVTIAAPEGTTKDGLGYGVLLNGTGAPAGARRSIEDLTGLLIQQIQANNPLEQLSRSEPITVGGIKCLSTMLQSPSPFPDARGAAQNERDWLITVPRKDGSLIWMIFVAPQSDFDRFKPTYEAMLESAKFK
jgi:Zn-dependent protease with chaperone function